MSSQPRNRLWAPRLSALLLATALVGVGCGRSHSTPTLPTPTPAGSVSSQVAAGDFGSAKKVCSPGSGTGGSGRGVGVKTIRVGTLADPGAAATPGLGREFFETADAFVKWCNAAGGINGRKIVVDKRDAKLFNGASVVIDACRSDFMLVGGGNALDAADVKPRLACRLGQIPAYTATPTASNATLQVSPNASVSTSYPIGGLRLLAAAFPVAKDGLGIGASSIASVAPTGLRAQEAYQKLGYRVSTVQPRPALVDNYRPWMEQMKAAGSKADLEIIAQDSSSIFAAMNDTGFRPAFVAFVQSIYSPKAVAAAKSSNYLPPSYVNLFNLPFELSDEFPVVAQLKSILSANSTDPTYTFFVDAAFNSWVLWAQSATACGGNLTQACVSTKGRRPPQLDCRRTLRSDRYEPQQPQILQLRHHDAPNSKGLRL